MYYAEQNVSLENVADLLAAWPHKLQLHRECVELLLLNSENLKYVIDERVVEMLDNWYFSRGVTNDNATSLSSTSVCPSCGLTV